MSRLALHLLGPPRLERDGVPLEFDTRKILALVAYLAVTGATHTREALITLLWPELEPSRARAVLRRNLSLLRKALDGEWLVVDREIIGLDPDADAWVDVDQFRQRLGACETHGHPPTEACPECLPLLEEAAALYRDHFLAGFTLRDSAAFDEWQFFETEELKDQLASALVRLATYHTSQGDFESAIAHARRWLALDPLHEPAHRHLMVLYAQSNQRAAALRQYETCRQLLADELGVEPAEKTQETHERLLKGELPAGPTAVEAILERELRTVGECPYRGLSPFREADAAFFFGREAFTERLAEAVRTRPMVAVIVGSSGSGKSSAVFAGLLPRLREEVDWRVTDFRPGAEPFHALAAALLPILEPELRETERLIETRKLAQALDERDIPLYDVVERALKKSRTTSRLLLLIDQFEELYTLCPESEVRRDFVDALLAAVEAVEGRRESPFVLLLTMRADFMGQALAHRPFVDVLQESSLLLGPMTREELRTAIEKPAQKQGAALEAGLVERLLDDVGEEPGNLPLLEFALTLLWERLDYGWMTHGAYEEIRRVEGALARYAEEVYHGLAEEEREQARQIFVQLVQPGEGTEDTRRVATRAELGNENWGLVQHLADQRLVVTGRDPTSGRETVEVVHEALIQRWGQLRGWMAEDRAFRTWQERLRVALRGWEATGEDEGALVRGAPLVAAEDWLAERETELSAGEKVFIRASIELRERQAAERQRRRRRIFAGLSAGLIIATVLAVVAFFARQQANEKARIALANGLAAQSLLLLGEELDLALLLSVQAYDTLDTVQTQSSLLSALQYSPGLVHLLRGHTAGVLGVALSSDGRIVASGSQDGTVRLWDAETGLPVGGADGLLTGHTSEVSSVAFSPDGRILASCGREQRVQQADEPLDNAILLWDVETGRTIGQPLIGYPGYLNAVAFSPDGRILASGGCRERPEELEEADIDRSCTQSQILLWDVETGQPIGEPFSGSIRSVKGLAFSSNGQWLASAGCGGTLDDAASRCSQGEIILWDVETGQVIGPPLAGHGDWVKSLAFSPDGKILASGSDDATVRLWDVSDGSDTGAGDEASPAQPIGRPLIGHAVSVESVAFSPDGRTLVSGGGDHTIRLWDVGTGRPIGLPIAGHAARVTSVAYSPDGETLVSGGGSPDNTVRLWDPAIGGSVGSLFATYPNEFIGVAFSPDGRTLAAGSCRDGYVDSEGICRGGLLHVWSVADGPSFGQRIVEPIIASDASWVAVVNTAFSPDGTILASSGLVDKSVRLWDTETWQPIGEPLTGHADWALAGGFSPDGRILVTNDWGGIIRLWDVASRQPIGEPLTGHTWCAYVMEFTPDGETLVSSSWDGTVRLWDVGDGPSFGQPIGEPLTTTSAIIGMALSADGRTLATGQGYGNTDIILWDLDTRQPIGPPLTGHTGDVDWLVFSPDGRTLISSSNDATIRLWDVESGRGIGGPLIGHTDTIIVIALSPDGRTLASSSWDGTIRLWDMDPESWKARVCQIAGRNMARDEWEQYLPGEPYRKTCPQWPEGE